MILLRYCFVISHIDQNPGPDTFNINSFYLDQSEPNGNHTEALIGPDTNC